MSEGIRDTGGKPRRIAGIRARVIVLILITQAVFIYWVADSEIVGGIYLICYSIMMPTAIYLLAPLGTVLPPHPTVGTGRGRQAESHDSAGLE